MPRSVAVVIVTTSDGGKSVEKESKNHADDTISDSGTLLLFDKR